MFLFSASLESFQYNSSGTETTLISTSLPIFSMKVLMIGIKLVCTELYMTLERGN